MESRCSETLDSVSMKRFVVSLTTTNSSTFHYNFIVTTPLDTIFVVLPFYSCERTVVFGIILFVICF